jgi:hypothetical protein
VRVPDGGPTLIEILCSGMSLGHFTPGLMVRDEFRRLGMPARINIFENLLSVDVQHKIAATKRAYHASQRLARTGQLLSKQLAPQPVEFAVKGLVEHLRQSPPTAFVVLSGYWLPLLQGSLVVANHSPPIVHLLHIDSSPSPSWATHAASIPYDFSHIWWLSYDHRKLLAYLPADRAGAPWAERRDVVVAHGGGWGIGDYPAAVPELCAHGYEVALVHYYEEEVRGAPGVHPLLLDPDWVPWMPDGLGEYSFPPMLDSSGGQIPGAPFVRLIDHISRAAAIISKPGGATLVESFAVATPVVFLDAYGPHEQRNADLWRDLGFGLTLEEWRATGFARDALTPLHQRIVEAQALTPSYPELLVRALEARTS